MGVKDPVLRERSKHSTPEATAEAPHSQFVRKQGNVGAFGTHLDHGLVCVRLFFFEVDCAPDGAGTQAVDV